MSVYYYDQAVTKKLQRWIKDPDVKITSPDETRRIFEYVADRSNDESIKLPLVALRRLPDIDLKNTNKHSKTFDGAVIRANGTQVEVMNVVPIQITYQLDIYCRYQQEADEYARNFIFNLINYPKVTVEVPYNDANLEHDSNISLLETLTDGSDIPERLIPGQFSRWVLKFNIPDAYLFSIPIRPVVSVDAEMVVALENSVGDDVSVELK